MPRHRVLAVLPAVALLAAGSAALCAPRASLVAWDGTVKVLRAGQTGWLQMTTRSDRSLYSQDQVQTYQRAWATIAIDGSRVSVPARTRVVIPGGSAAASRGWSPLRLITGKLLLWIIGKQEVKVSGPGATAGARGTQFIMEVGDDGLTTVTVLESEVTFYNELGSVVVRANEQSSARPGSPPTRPMAVDPSQYLWREASIDSSWLDFEFRHFPSETRESLQGMADEAVRDAEADPTDAEAQLRAGNALHDLGDFTGAEGYYRRALDLDPTSAPAQASLGHTLLRQGRAAEAEEVLLAAGEAAPTSAAPLIGLAVARLATRPATGTEAAPALLQRALALEPGNALAHAVAGLAAIRAGDAAAARRSLEQAIAADADLFQAHAYLSVVDLANSDVDAGVAAARRAVELAPASALAHASLATAAFFGKDAALAETEAALALEADPGSVAAHLVRSDLLVTRGELTEAADEAALALTLDPQCAPAYSALGMIALAQNDLGTADRCFSRALELSPDLVAARTGLGVTYAREGKLARALDMQKAAIALDSGSAATRHNLGAIHLAEGRLEEAVAAFEEAIRLQPEWALPHANLALAYLDLNRFADAVRAGERAVRLGEDSARTHTTLGRVYLEQNRTSKAWAALRRAVDRDPTYALARFELAEVYLRLGRARDARREQLEAIALQPSAALETREYARTEARLDFGSLDAQLRTDGRVDDGRTSYFASAEREIADWGRERSQWTRTSAQGVFGREPAADRAAALVFSAQAETRDRPGAELAGGLPEDPDYRSEFDAWEGHALMRIGAYDEPRYTVKLSYRQSELDDHNPDAVIGDPKPFPRMKLRYTGPLAEVRMDRDLTDRDHLTAGVAGSLEQRTISGIVGTPNPPGSEEPITWTPFFDEDEQDAVTFYLEHEHRFGEHTTAMVGGRIAATNSTTAVARPKAWVRHEFGDSTVALLTRPVLRDDVSELSPVDTWGLADGLSPLDFTDGGFGQSYELQYQYMSRNGLLVRVSGFHRSLRNFLVDLEDPVWAPGAAAAVLDHATLTGAEAEFEHWLSRDLSLGGWVRFTDSEIEGSGGFEVPFQPKWLAQAHLDYLSRSGLRGTARWRHIGQRYTDLANTDEADSYSLVDLAAAYQLDLHTDLFIGVDNLLDEETGFYPGYPSRGRWLHGGVEYRF